MVYSNKVAGFEILARQVTIDPHREGRTIKMAFLKRATAIAALASAGVVGMAGIASAAADDARNGGREAHKAGDNNVSQAGLFPVNTLNNVNLSPNLGCLAHNTVPDLTVTNGLTSPIGASLNHLLQHVDLNVLSNGNITTDNYDNSCQSNQGSSQAGNNSHGSVGAGDSSSSHSSGDGAGSQNDGAGAGAAAGGLFGSSHLLG